MSVTFEVFVDSQVTVEAVHIASGTAVRVPLVPKSVDGQWVSESQIQLQLSTQAHDEKVRSAYHPLHLTNDRCASLSTVDGTITRSKGYPWCRSVASCYIG